MQSQNAQKPNEILWKSTNIGGITMSDFNWKSRAVVTENNMVPEQIAPRYKPIQLEQSHWTFDKDEKFQMEK